MKKILFIISLNILFATNLFAQDLNGVYFVFKSEDGNSILEEAKPYSGKIYRSNIEVLGDSIITFKGYSTCELYPCLELWHTSFATERTKAKSKTKMPHESFITDIDLVSKVRCYYWDDLKTLKNNTLINKFNEFIKDANIKIYAVDLSNKLPDAACIFN